MTFNEKEFTEQLDICITKAEEEVAEVEAPVDTDAPAESTVKEDEDDDMPSELGPEELEAELPVEGDTDDGFTITPVDEDGVEGDTVEVEGDEPTEPAASVISDYAIHRAGSVGISPEHASAFPSVQELLAEVRHLEDQGVRTQEAEKAPTPAADPLADMPDLDPEEYDESVSKVVEMFNGLKAIAQNQSSELASLRESQAAGLQASQEVSAREITQWFDESINSLGFEESLGSGASGSQVPGSSQLAKRNAIADKCAVQMRGYEASGIQAPSREEIFRDSARLVLADEYQTLRDKELSSGLKKRAGQHIARANGKKTKSKQSPEEHTAALLDEKYPSN
jgi:hypothetical protein